MTDFARELNAEQLQVVEHGDGPCLVLAGAGSGKTRTITYRVAYLLERGVKPENILLVTFTNKAADEMIARVQTLTGRSERLPWAGTFHSIGHKLLRAHADVLGYQKNFTILDADDSEAMMKLAAKDYAGGSSKGKKFPSAGVLQAIVSYARNAQTTVAEVLDARYSQFSVWEDAIIEIAAEYEKKKKEANAMDFDDLLVNADRLLNDQKILKKYAAQFEYVLVDEYQDTNKIQADIVKKLASVHKNILVVGDDAQSIYSFRGADIENILGFERAFSNAHIFRLETNYRSSQEILQVANAVIANNPKQYKKNLKTILKTGVKPELHPQSGQTEEASFIADKVSSLIRGGVPHKEIAVLFRAAHHSQQLELELMRYGIDYDYRGGLRFFERSHVKDVLAYLRLLANLSDTTAWLRVLLHEDGIGPSSAGKIIEKVKHFVILNSKGVKDLSLNGKEILRFAQNDIGGCLGDKARAGWNNFLTIWDGLLDIGKGSPAELIKFVAESPYKDYLEAERVDSAERLNDIKQLAVFAQKYGDLEEFLAAAALQEAFNLERQKKKAGEAHDNKIVLSTIHQAKGLEWSAVFVINLANGGFPNERALREDNGVEEERRLFYVAVTRAKKYLYFTYPLTLNAGHGNQWGEALTSGGPSIFLGEIHPKFLNDKSLLGNANYLNSEVEYVSEDAEFSGKPIKIKPGSFLRSVEDL